jgi:hypothetical protein
MRERSLERKAFFILRRVLKATTETKGVCAQALTPTLSQWEREQKERVDASP